MKTRTTKYNKNHRQTKYGITNVVTENIRSRGLIYKLHQLSSKGLSELGYTGNKYSCSSCFLTVLKHSEHRKQLLIRYGLHPVVSREQLNRTTIFK